MIREAALSGDLLYRYALSRAWDGGDAGRLVFIGTNPSTADGAQDDHTIRKLCGFAHRWGFQGFTVVNAFAYRATEVRALAEVADPVGPGNAGTVRHVLRGAALVVPCWGAATKLPTWPLRHALTAFAATVRRSSARARCLGYTAGGDPRHPLMLPYHAALVAWPRS